MLKADQQVAFPVSGHGTIVGFSGPLADRPLSADMTPGLALRPRPRHPQRPPGAQTGDQLALERSAALNVERLVDRLVADPHGLILGEIDLEAPRDLLGAPALHPAAISPMGFPLPVPGWTRWTDQSTIGGRLHARQSLLNVVTQPLVDC